MMNNVFNDICNNLDKFNFKRHCGFVYWYEFKNVKIKFNSANIIPEYSLYHCGYLVKLNFFEKRKLKRIIKKLNKMRINSLKMGISKEFSSQ